MDCNGAATMAAFDIIQPGDQPHPPTDYNYKGDMKKRINIMEHILKTDTYALLDTEDRAGLDVPDATDIAISKRKCESAVQRFRNQIKKIGMRQLTDLACPGLWDLESRVKALGQTNENM